METLFKNKVAIVTGAASGIGRATALAFAKKGAKVVIADWTDGNVTLKLIKDAGGEALVVKCDVSKSADVKMLIEKTVSTYGQIDFAVNNAGITGISAPTHECTEENWDKTIDVNLKGVWLCMKYEIAQMLKQGKGAIVNTASVAGFVAFVNIPAYVASKHGILGLTKNAAMEYARLGIRVNAVCPGVINTPMVHSGGDENKEAEKIYANLEPIGRIGEPEEIANAILWLCSDEASFVTGHSMVVDGGWIAQ
ncbi:MAG TPA: SDR family oxidoreductase [Bacteroidia bacterium]|nr:SDR family oxidoreductase [Bacteroidia bacterium]